jgi:hypothetical protein
MRYPVLTALALTVMPLLAACQTMTPEERRAADQRACVGYGFKPGTNAMAQCLLDLDLDRRADSRAWRYQQSVTMWGPVYARGFIVY